MDESWRCDELTPGLAFANIVLLALLAWDRRDGIVRPLLYSRIVNHKRRAALMIAASLALGMRSSKYNQVQRVQRPSANATPGARAVEEGA